MSVALCAIWLAGCGTAGTLEATTFAEVGESVEVGFEWECTGAAQADCDEALQAIREFLPADSEVASIEICPLEERLAVTPQPEWAASAQVRLADGSDMELVVIRPMGGGPLEVNLAPD